MSLAPRFELSGDCIRVVGDPEMFQEWPCELCWRPKIGQTHKFRVSVPSDSNRAIFT